jgi:hypothetical protein
MCSQSLSIQTVKDFLQKEGSIGVVDHTGITRMLHTELPEYLDLTLEATRLWHKGMWHSRDQFLQLCANSQMEASLP